MKRYALVTLPTDRDNPVAYMPGNYSVLHIEPHPEGRGWRQAVIGGEDSHGWTLEGYVLPRLASGGMPGTEIDLSHDVMKRVPDDVRSHYVIAGYVDDDDGTLYWSNDGGWVTLQSATVFTEAERADLCLPMGDDARWVQLPTR